MTKWSDEQTLYLAIVLGVVYAARNFLKSSPAVHPLLLGRQSWSSQVRNPRDSAVYRNYGVAASSVSSPLPTSPARGVTTVLDLLRLDSPHGSKERRLWGIKINNTELRRRMLATGSGLCVHAGLIPGASRVLLLLDHCLEWIVADLALAYYGIPTLGLSSSTLLNSVLENYPPDAIIIDSHSLEKVLEAVVEYDHQLVVIVVNDKANRIAHYQGKTSVKLISWEHVETTNTETPRTLLPDSSSIFTASFHALHDQSIEGVQLTHQNVVAGVTGVLNLFPSVTPISEKDSILSSFSLSTPVGRAIAYSAIFSGADFSTTQSSNLFADHASKGQADIIQVAEDPEQSAPTILFVSSNHLSSLCNSVLASAKKNPVSILAKRHKRAGILAGSLSSDTIWDKYCFNFARGALGRLGHSLRLIAFDGQINNESHIDAKIAMSCPVVHMHTHPFTSSPIFASHPHDHRLVDGISSVGNIQEGRIHTGPPTCVVEVKLSNINEDLVAKGHDPVGKLLIRGPVVGERVPSVEAPLPDDWVDTNETARIRASGVFVIEDSGAMEAAT